LYIRITDIKLVRLVCVLGIIFLLFSAYLIHLNVDEIKFSLSILRNLLLIYLSLILGLSFFIQSTVLQKKELIFTSIALSATTLMIWFFYKNGFSQNRFFSASIMIVLFTFLYQKWRLALLHILVFVSIIIALLFQSDIVNTDRLDILSSIIPSSIIALAIIGVKVNNELVLKKSQEITNAIFGQSNDAFILTKNESKKFVDCNQSTLNLFKYDSKLSLINNIDAILRHPSLVKLLKSNSANFECRLKTNEGNDIWTNVAVKHIATENDKLTLYRFTDVSELKQIELALIENDKQFSNIIKRSSILIFAIDLFGKFSLTNQHLTAINSDYQKIGEYSKKIYNTKPEIQQNLLKALSGEVFSDICEIDNINYKINYSPLYNEKNHINGGIGVAVDVTELMRVEKSLKQYAVQLESSNQELEQFAYIASHDLREPLRMITNYLQLLQNRYQSKLDSEADEFIEYAVSGAQRMNVLINDLLQYSRVGTKASNLEKIDGDLILRAALNNLSLAIQENKAKISAMELPVLVVDKTQFIQLFQNLIANAIKYRSTERKPAIEINVKDKITEWHFSVSDNGIGIEKEYLERIFGIFQRLHTIDKYQGTGIGLAVCKKIVEKHHGEIWAESKIGESTTFYFTLPKL